MFACLDSDNDEPAPVKVAAPAKTAAAPKAGAAPAKTADKSAPKAKGDTNNSNQKLIFRLGTQRKDERMH